MDSIRRVFLGVSTAFFFGVFGLGSLIMAPLMLLLGRVERCQPAVRFVWIPLMWLGVITGIIRYNRGNLPNCRGTIIVANHPSLIDVMFFTMFIPRTLSIAKREVAKNPVMGIVANSTTILVGADLDKDIAPYLEKGWNILIFPEGTRSPFTGTEVPQGCPPELHPFHRGAAQLALRTGAPVVCVGVHQSRRIFAKHQSILDIGPKTVRYTFTADEPTIEKLREGESLHSAAIRVTAELERRVKGLLS